MKLYMFVVGGSCGNSNVELHDIRFAAAETLEGCLDDLRRQWWGDPGSLHLDCWGEVTQADGHDVALAAEATAGPKLFFVNLGGYSATEFGELHRNLLVVAKDAKVASARAKAQVTGWESLHKDYVFEVDRAIDVGGQLGGVAIVLTPAAERREFRFDYGYWPIGAAGEQRQSMARPLSGSDQQPMSETAS